MAGMTSTAPRIVRAPVPWSGIVGALVAFALSLTPSLLPRPALYLGLIAAVSGLMGYGVGVLIARLVRLAGVRPPSHLVRRRAWQALAVAGPLLAVAALVMGGIWQEQVRALVGEAPQPISILVVALVASAVFALLLLISRAIRLGTRTLARQANRVVPLPAARLIAVVVVVAVSWWVASGVLAKQFVAAMDGIYSAQNETTDEGVTAPASAMRSGSPQSLVPWDTIGRQGQAFVAGGPSVAQLAEVAGKPAVEPIRAYAGLLSAPTARERAALAVAELERTGAFDRAVLVVAGATGTGWLEPQTVDAIEYMWGGDTAIVTSQYSYLPSWISFLVDQDRARDAGRELFDAVHAAWLARPADQRPKLIAYGLSLGSFSIQSAFGSGGALTALTDGALLVGTPNFAEPWQSLTNSREAGSPQWQPVVREGRHIRFAAVPADLERPTTPWEDPRVVYLQHANDPVVWWSWDLIAQRPDWLAEPRGAGVSDATVWIPGITFLQVTVDQFFGVDVPDGQGHNYPGAIVGAWAAVTQPPGWTPADTDALQARIDDVG